MYPKKSREGILAIRYFKKWENKHFYPIFECLTSHRVLDKPNEQILWNIYIFALFNPKILQLPLQSLLSAFYQSSSIIHINQRTDSKNTLILCPEQSIFQILSNELILQKYKTVTFTRFKLLVDACHQVWFQTKLRRGFREKFKNVDFEPINIRFILYLP